MDCSLLGSSVHGILQARMLEWVATPFFRESSQSRNWTQVSCIVGGFFTIWATREAQKSWVTYPISRRSSQPGSLHPSWILYQLSYQGEEACEQQPESRPRWPQLEKNPSSNKDPAQPKINKERKLFLKRRSLAEGKPSQKPEQGFWRAHGKDEFGKGGQKEPQGAQRFSKSNFKLPVNVWLTNNTLKKKKKETG